MVSKMTRHEQHRLSSGTARVQGHEIGSPVSLFLVHAEPGCGSGMHVHPYVETWVVQRGEVHFTVGTESASASTGDIVVGPANVPHQFINIGREKLELVCIHAAAKIEQRQL